MNAMNIIGLMSGTSGDGVDVALCRIEGEPPTLSAAIVRGWHVPYEDNFRQTIFRACTEGNARDICRLNAALGERFADAIRHGMDDLRDVHLIASHGQTIWHEVGADGGVHSTLQIGAAAVIAERTGLTTVSNFRERDVAAGGAGAPLTAYADWLLLRHPHEWRAVQNIGGMGNVTFLPPHNDRRAALTAFDTGPGNALIDAAMYQLTGQPYDAGGELAASGRVDEAWLADLLAHRFYAQPPPRTTGRELFGTAYAADCARVGAERGLSAPDIIATLTALTAHSIARAYRDFAPSPPQSVILGGGGVHNQTLVRLLGDLLGVPVMNHEAVGIDSDFKEALVFAVLAYETWHNRVGSLPEQTGGRSASVLGQITPGANYAALIRETWA
ncbi:MAG: anhydro-N-acetylmuramic acid kinase [Anaerolineaceae bacterium]|nr:MAG: anhydro-N-acetylmuramic acid kinase [Anaerolineaceae bacterium]